MDLDRKRVAVLDLTHGGIPISIKLAELGAEVSAVDVYNTVDAKTLSELEVRYGVRTSKEPLPVGDFDLFAAPVHLDPAYPMLAKARKMQKPVLSHHRIVGTLLAKDKRLAGTRTIEITGVKAKTSTASLLADILSRKSHVVLHTSRGLEAWKDGIPSEIRKGLSITPGSILSAVDRAFEAGALPEYFIFEISIGGTGNADLGVLTTLTPDYGIANNSSLASKAKLQLIHNAKAGSALVLNTAVAKALGCEGDVAGNSIGDAIGDSIGDAIGDSIGDAIGDSIGDSIEDAIGDSIGDAIGDAVPENVRAITFRDPFLSGSGEAACPFPADFVLETDENTITCLCRGRELFTARLKPGYNSSAYRTAFAASSAAALELGVESGTIKAVFEEFGGLAGRMQEKEVEGIALIDNSNSGMDIRSAEKALEYALLKKKDERKQKIFIVLGEEAAQVCEGLPPETVQAFVEKSGKKFERIVLVGERMRSIRAGNTDYADSLPEGLARALELAGETDIIISSVKCFR